jgi:NAD(P)-dependent dehydrogenase (short-subunit alcohol dehydrogenase family)
MNIAGTVAIVTGAGGGGQGRAVAMRLAKEGASVVLSDLDEAGGHETLRRIQAGGGKGAFFRADAGIENDLRALIGFAVSTFGGLDILVNNAGPYFPGAPLERWDETLKTNLVGAMNGTLFAIEPMRRRGGGAIVYYGSTSAVGHGKKHCSSPAYDVAKAGVARLATTLGWMREAYGIRVNCIVPDWVATDEIREYVDTLDANQRRAAGVPETLTTLDEIASAVLRLISDESLFGRVLVWWSGQPPGLIPIGDPGYTSLDRFAV